MAGRRGEAVGQEGPCIEEAWAVKTIDANAAQAWFLVRIDARPYAVALHAVAEIVESERLVRLPLGPPRVLGLCTYRRDLVPVISFDEPSADATVAEAGRPVVLILRGEHGTWGLKIDRGGTLVAEGPLEDCGTASASPGGAVVIGMITRGASAHAVIDAEGTWWNARDAIERWYNGDPNRAAAGV
jgi:purine-binding chemotaxis protein CheW